VGGIAVKKARLNIYVDNPMIRKQVKTVAARRDISVSEYCLKAIAEKLAGEEPLPDRSLLAKAVGKARRFQRKAFAGRTFSVSSANLIAQVRRERARR
jgi:hypothetical protein